MADDASVIEIYEQWQAEDSKRTFEDAYFHHLVAVAFARCSSANDARAQWEIALEHRPDIAIAERNLNELLFPVGKRHGAWPFPITDWLSSKTIEDFQQILSPFNRALQVNKLRAVLKKFVEQHPNFIQQNDSTIPNSVT